MQTHSFKIVGGDTDSIMFCKQDMSPFSEDEQEALLKEINSLLPQEIKFANDGIFPKVIYLKAKNYVMLDGKGKKKIKGSSLKSSTMEPILKQMLNEIIDAIMSDEEHKIKSIYNKYLELSQNITDITPWCSKKTLSPTTFNSDRKQETDIIDSIRGKEYGSGDRIYLFTSSKIIETGEVYKRTGLPKTKSIKYLTLKEDFTGEYCKKHYAKRVQETFKRFLPVLPEEMFLTDD
jgi:hypothetical protein